ncbi:MAG: DNA polymerase IV [Oscillospiraceae bacterium]|nr:DNA polymerase IV [Oscillospiraceae bacterium]
MDAFFAAVEVRDDPSLRGKPLIIGSLPAERGVVATCSYEARKYGVHSAMNIKEAYRLCPNGIYMHPNIEKYRAVSEQLHVIWNSYATALESVAYDEAYLDVKERAGNFEGAGRIAREIKRRTKEELGLSCSVGVAYSKTAAKIASEEKKPDGYFEILTPRDFVDLIIDRDVRTLYTVGSKTAERLRASGIRTVRDIRENPEEVVRLLGKQGEWIAGLAFGKDDRKVTPYRPEDAKSISREVTFQKDVSDFGFVKDVLALLAICVERRMKRHSLYGSGVTLKITYGDMKSITRSRLGWAADDASAIFREAVDLMQAVDRRPIRLVGVGVYNLSDDGYRQMTIYDYLEETEAEREKGRKDLLEPLRRRYGLDFAGHLEEIERGETLHRTIEYMRRHRSTNLNREEDR